MRKLALAALLAALPSVAAAQTFPTIPANTVVGRLAIGPGPAQAIPFASLANQFTTFTAPVTIAPPTAGTTALTLTVPGNFGYGIGQQQAVSGNLTSLQYFINYLFVADTADASATAGNTVYGYSIDYAVGGSTVKGSRSGIRSNMTLSGATNAANTNRFYLAGFFISNAATGDGGTDTGAGALGYIGGLNVGSITTTAAATNLETIVGIEINVNMFAGSTTKNRIGIILAPNDGGTGQGASVDAGIAYSNAPGTSGWRTGIVFSGAISAPISTDGTILATSSAYTITNGIDISSVTISGSAFKSPNFTVTGGGVVTATVGNNYAFQALSGSPTGFGGVSIGRTGTEVGVGIIGATNQVLTGTAVGDGVIVGVLTGTQLWLGNQANDKPSILIKTDGTLRFSQYTAGIVQTDSSGNLTSTAKIRAAGTAPALTSCGGGSPTITGSDLAGEVTMGTTATGCVITFNAAYSAIPYCVVTWPAQILASQSYAVSTSAITLTQTSASGNKVYYHCMARSGG